MPVMGHCNEVFGMLKTKIHKYKSGYHLDMCVTSIVNTAVGKLGKFSIHNKGRQMTGRRWRGGNTDRLGFGDGDLSDFQFSRRGRITLLYVHLIPNQDR